MKKKLQDLLLAALEVGFPNSGLEVSGVSSDTRLLEPGNIFCAIKGAEFDGQDFVEEAVNGGAVCVVTDHPSSDNYAVPQVEVSNARQALALLACEFYDHPAKELCLVGVTGTNGKTTVTNLISEMSTQPAQALGTLTPESNLTTPSAPQLQSLLAQFRKEGTKLVAMEVSSHSLAQHRVDGMDFSVGVFLNLSQDHLDYHQDLDDYFAQKTKLFRHSNLAVVNVDTSWGQKLSSMLGGKQVISISSNDLDIKSSDFSGSEFKWQNKKVRLSLPGQQNIINSLAALATLEALDQDIDACIQKLATLTPIPGRFEVVANEPFKVVVDYAHTPNALKSTLKSLRPLTDKSIILVFGCGGDRDKQKRPEMGKVAEQLADVIILTSDNSRSEKTSEIIKDILAESFSSKIDIVEDRYQAIQTALSTAQPGDAVLLAGKGHETIQIIGQTINSFSDVETAKSLLAKMEAVK